MKCLYLFDKVDSVITDFDNQLSSVSQFRCDRANTYKFDDDKRRSLAATILLDRLLKNYSLNEKDMLYKTNSHGKPIFSNSELQFSLSHSGEYVLAALDYDEIGCDIQKTGKADFNIAKRFFTPNECDYIKKDCDFFRVWTLKESFVKALGCGLSIPLNSFEIKNINDNPYVIYNDNKYIFIEDGIEGYMISICKKAR